MHRKIDSSVECNSGFSACDYPTAIWWQGRRLKVKIILKEWREPSEKCYRLLVNDNLYLEARLNEKENTWQVNPFNPRCNL